MPDLRLLGLKPINENDRNRRGRNVENIPDGAVARLTLALPSGATRNAYLNRGDLVRLTRDAAVALAVVEGIR